ncbi:MFS transporter [Alcaligenes endophyticus]|uniref:MFS transporter n=1 Tax=Alcaligenes endophyticus TaxID=1929088 RepID=A0ABT8EI57_9BURK|nr:MFS transporter [Alcaligenes endophyticus]MCX5592784.1 MFS transporter [Alcaligenes endophyticus]MDN4120972.1 MFS transporter [Alcaligenes endophyticus]
MSDTSIPYALAGTQRQQDWRVITVVGIAHASSHFFQLLLPTLYIALNRQFGYDFVSLATLVTLFYLVSCIGQASSGFLVDRIGAVPVLKFGLACFVLAALLIASANSYWILVLAALIGGIGNAIFHPVDYYILNHRVSPQRLGHAFSAHGFTGNLGWALTPVFVTGLSSLFGWRVAVYAVAGLIALVLALVWGNAAYLRGTTASETNSNAEQSLASATILDTLKTLLSQSTLWGAFLFFAFATAAVAVVQNYTIPLLSQTYGVDELRAGTALSSYMLAAAGGMILGGFIASHNPRAELVVFISLVIAGIILAVLGTGWLSARWALVLVALAGLCSGVSSPSRDLLIRKATPKGATGTVYGLVYSGMDVGSSMSPLFFGLFIDAGWRQVPWFGAGLAYWVAAGLALYVAIVLRQRALK